MKKPGLFQIVTFAIAVVSLALNVVLLLALNRGRLAAAQALKQAGEQTAALANESIHYTFALERVVSIKTDVPFDETIPVAVDFEVEQVLPVDVVIPFDDTFTIPISATIPVDTAVQIAIPLPFGQSTEMTVPVQGNFPVNLPVDVPISTEIPIQASVPVKVPVNTVVMVDIKRTVTVDTDIPLNLDLPITINLQDTPFGGYLAQVGESLQQLASRLGE
ncbi:MAG: hypothetical protein ACE5G8_09515 [Anaerolineae bacterium]